MTSDDGRHQQRPPWREDSRRIPCHCAPDIPLNVSFCMPAPVAAR